MDGPAARRRTFVDNSVGDRPAAPYRSSCPKGPTESGVGGDRLKTEPGQSGRDHIKALAGATTARSADGELARRSGASRQLRALRSPARAGPKGSAGWAPGRTRLASRCQYSWRASKFKRPTRDSVHLAHPAVSARRPSDYPRGMTDVPIDRSRPIPPSEQPARLAALVAAVRARTDLVPRVGIVLGSGLGSLADGIEDPVAIPFEDLPGWPAATAPGHVGRLLLGTLAGVPVVVAPGPFPHLRGQRARAGGPAGPAVQAARVRPW